MRNCKEYLEKQEDGTYALVLHGDLCKDDDIEVPDGMNYAYDAGSFIQFTKQEMGYRDSVLVWQREQDEPFLTPETTLNDQYAEIEEVRQQSIEATLAERQSTYGSFEDVAFYRKHHVCFGSCSSERIKRTTKHAPHGAIHDCFKNGSHCER